MTGYEDDDDVGGYEPPERRVRTTGPGHDPSPAASMAGEGDEDRDRWYEESAAEGDDRESAYVDPEQYGGDAYDETGVYDEDDADDADDADEDDDADDYAGEQFDPEDPLAPVHIGVGDADEADSDDPTGEVPYITDDEERSETSPAGGAHRRPSGSHLRPGRRSKADSRHRRILVGVALVLVALLIVGGVGWIYARRAINPGGPLGSVVTVKIPTNSSTTQIGKILAGAGVIHEARLFPFYTKLNNTPPLLPGTYRLAKNESYSRVVRILAQGPPLIVDKLTIPEGFTLAQIAARVAALPGLHLSAAKFLAASSSGRVRSQFEPPGVNNLEGLVFPATYPITQGQEETDILQEMVNTFDQRVISLGIVAAAAKMHYTPYQVVTVASIVEREAKLAVDRPYVASVLYNRLARNIPLGADSTQTYYLRLTNPYLDPSVTQLEEPSPYNTRLNPGLPPTPIANPGIPSLQAAISPVSSSYLYFVEVNPDGKLGFATNATGFAQLQAQCRSANLC